MISNNLRKNPREISLDIIMDITESKEKGDKFSHIVVNKTFKKYEFLDKQDRSFINKICEGTLERIITIDFIINHYSKIKVKKMKPLIRALLRISVYQIKYMDGTADFAVCNEAIKIAKKRGFKCLSGFINGVLRNIIRNPQKVVFPEEKKEPIKYLSIKYSAPEWLVSQFIEQYDYYIAKAMLADSIKEKQTSIRCNLQKTSVANLKEELIKENVKVEDGFYLDYALRISNYDSIEKLNTFQKGMFQVQDESSMLVGEIAYPSSATRTVFASENPIFLDVCAAPGGKSLHLAQKLDNTGLVLSRDISQKKVDLIINSIKKMGLDNIKPQVFDALDLDESLIEKVDLVLADLPCSGLGIIAKKPDIKYNMNRGIQKDLVELQRQILKVVYKYVKPGGVLIYSTCTVNKEENIKNIEWFTKHFPFYLESFCLESFDSIKGDGFITLLPGIHQTDGFFITKLIRSVEG